VTTVAIVAQKSEAVARFIEANPLPFRVLIDTSRDVLRAYRVWHRIGFDAWNIARPALFLIARDGTVVRKFVARTQTEFPSHTEIMEWLGELENLRI
jgi:peroxiredoxin Q/BCP